MNNGAVERAIWCHSPARYDVLCDDSEDLKDIKNPPMGTKAYIIHEKRIVIADSSGKSCDM